MRKNVLLILALLPAAILNAQNYQPNWASLDGRPTPAWFTDAKFGIFIHWGVYSVPAWCPKGSYAEWYQYGLQTNDTARQAFHRKKYGDLTYYQLADQLKAELFDPNAWAKLFEQSGAKYIVLTSKHHDGFCLWPNQTADKTWGFPWNAAEVGPHRDLLGDLFKAVRKTSVRAGMYYSLYEWFNPLWKADHAAFAEAHTWPQMKELINTYQPDVFWTDGDWDASPETWKSQEFLAWLYNESPVKDKVVVNDRWGSGVRFHHGGIYTPEYQPNLSFDNHYWEESRGMGFSYGYNREEDAWDYNSAQSLVLQLVDKVSRGGNFLLDIGPDAHGKIPPIMQERLLAIGKWLKKNGEAIYGSTTWLRPSQWSEGRTDYVPPDGGGDLLLKLTIDPDLGFAVKEAFFTYRPDLDNLYAILPRYPSGKAFRLKNVELPTGTVISLLSTGQTLQWSQEGREVLIRFPDYDPNTMEAPYAYVLKIAHYGKFTASPHIEATYAPGERQPMVKISGDPSASIRYTLDGSEPTRESPTYQSAFRLTKTATVRARAFLSNALPSAEASREAEVYEWMPAEKAGRLKPGLNYTAYELESPKSVSAINTAAAAKSGIASQVGIDWVTRKENTGLRLEGYLRIPESAIYEFFLDSDDGSVLWIDGREIMNNDGLHGTNELNRSVALKKGDHRIRIDYIQATGGIQLSLKVAGGKLEKQLVPASWYGHR